MISFGINTFLWVSPFTTRDIPLIEKGKSFGYDVVEIPIEGMQDIDYAKAAEAYKRAEVRASVCAIMGPSRDPSHEDPAIQKNGISYLKHCVGAAARLGAPTLAGPIYAAVGRQWTATPEQRLRDLERCSKNLKEVAHYAEDSGVTLAIEPLNRFETSFINLTEQAIELMNMIGSPNIRLMMDTFHANIEEKSLGQAIESAGSALVHIHANENDRGIPGTGHLSWKEIAISLKKINYNGPMVIESFSTEVKEIARAAAVWRPLFPSADILAREGLAFLKRLMDA
ncbi:MAG TPA: sugar phosphate isomerase/epimerase family protein [Spirochaetia bacterium]|nr:sugar phosphate isomerase/epimerase family protein [Spirochaetia bacterium]